MSTKKHEPQSDHAGDPASNDGELLITTPDEPRPVVTQTDVRAEPPTVYLQPKTAPADDKDRD